MACSPMAWPEAVQPAAKSPRQLVTADGKQVTAGCKSRTHRAPGRMGPCYSFCVHSVSYELPCSVCAALAESSCWKRGRQQSHGVHLPSCVAKSGSSDGLRAEQARSVAAVQPASDHTRWHCSSATARGQGLAGALAQAAALQFCCSPCSWTWRAARHNTGCPLGSA